MKSIEEQILRRAHEIMQRYNRETIHVTLSRPGFAALEIEMSARHIYAHAPRRIAGRFTYESSPGLPDEAALLLDRNGSVVGTAQLDLPPEVRTAPTPSPKPSTAPALAASLTPQMLSSARNLFYQKAVQGFQQQMYAAMGLTSPAEVRGPRHVELPTRKQKEGVVAYRVWRLADNGRLHSVTADQEWDGPVLRADAPPANGKPDPGFTGQGHGIYALREPAAAQPKQAMLSGLLVAGKIELRGKVVVHEQGYRAERARILELRLPKPTQRFTIWSPELIHELGERYQCEVKEGPWN